MGKFAKDLMAGMADVLAYAKGDTSRGVARTYVSLDIDIENTRKKIELTQEAFADLLSIDVEKLKKWAKHISRPTKPAYVFLMLIDKHPATFKKILKSLDDEPVAKSTKKKVAKKVPAVPKSIPKQQKIQLPKPIKNRPVQYAKSSKPPKKK